MQKKWLRIIAGIMFMSIILSGCAISPGGDSTEKADASPYEKIHEALMNMHSFQAEAAVKYISNKNTNEYITLQSARMSGEYRIEVTSPANVAGNITIFDGTKIYQFNPNVSDNITISVRETPERSQVFLTSFMKNYIASSQGSVTVDDFEEGRATILEANVPGTHPYMATQKLWVDNETLKPLQLIIYDADGIERIVITYLSFEYNPELDENIFQPPVE